MFQIIPVDEGNLHAVRVHEVRVSGKFTHKDYQEFLPLLKNLVKPDEKISLLIKLDDFHGVELAAIKDDFYIDLKHCEAIVKVAIIGDKKWQKWIALVSSPLVNCKIKFFDLIELESQEAMDWLQIY